MKLKQIILLSLLPALILGCGKSKQNDNGLKDLLAGDSNTSNSNVLSVLSNSGDFDIFVQGLSQANLTQTLSNGGSYTVFAPTDRAFQKLPAHVRRQLANNRNLLRQVLSYHLATSEVSSNDVSNIRRINTLQYEVLRLRRRNSRLFVNGIEVIQSDIYTRNAVVHIIDQVLIPQSVKNQLGL